jgi:chromatin remodeling complex protein RSC6
MSTEDVMKELTEMRKEIKSLAKMVRKLAKVQDDPDGTKAKERAANTGFNKPSKVTKELTDFMGLAEGTEVSRTDVTRFVKQYVKDKGLAHPEDGRKIIQDDAMKKLLQTPQGETLSYMSLQKHISKHFIKA